MYSPGVAAKIDELEKHIRTLKRESILGSMHTRIDNGDSTYIKVLTLRPHNSLGRTVEIREEKCGRTLIIFREEHNVEHSITQQGTMRIAPTAWNKVVARIRDKWSGRY